MKKFSWAQIAGLVICSTSLVTAAPVAASLANLPLYFEADGGPSGAPTQFIAHGLDSEFLISPATTQLRLRNPDSTRAVQMNFIGANKQAQIHGGSELSGKINYFTGKNPAQWRTDIPTFAKVRVNEIYPGINLVYYGNQQRIEYDFTIAPNADPNEVAIHFSGADKVSINPQGELVVKLGSHNIIQPQPLIYQSVNGQRKEIRGGYKLLDKNTVAFSTGQYDHALPLVIDPILSYSTYFGGTSDDRAWAVAVNTNDGSIYIAGQTFSSRFHSGGSTFSTPGAYQTNFQGGSLAGDAFVARLDNLGTNLIYLTYLGGSADDLALGIALDSTGDAYVAGATDSTNFPTTPGALYPNISGTYSQEFGSYPVDAFVTELNPSGSNLIYSTYMGGSGMDAALGIAVDSADNAYITGYTYSTNFPTKNPLPYQLAGRTNTVLNYLACTNSIFFNANAFVSEIAAGGSNLVFSTYFGGTNFDQGQGIAVDGNGYIYVTGFTASTNFPTYNALYPHLNGSTNGNNYAYDAFVAKFDPSGSNLVYSTFLGGTNDDFGYGIAVDNAGNAYVTGATSSTNFPNTVTNIGITSFLYTNQNYLSYVTNVFLTRIGPDGSTNNFYSLLFGGDYADEGRSVAVDASGEAFVTGYSTSPDFPTVNTNGVLRSNNRGENDAFITAVGPNASSVLYSVLLGGQGNDFGNSIALDPMDNAYVVGYTGSSDFPTTNAFQKSLSGQSDGILAKILFTNLPPVLSIAPDGTNVVISRSAFLQESQIQYNTSGLNTDVWQTLSITDPAISYTFTNGLQLISIPTAYHDTVFFRLKH